MPRSLLEKLNLPGLDPDLASPAPAPDPPDWFRFKFDDTDCQSAPSEANERCRRHPGLPLPSFDRVLSMKALIVFTMSALLSKFLSMTP